MANVTESDRDMTVAVWPSGYPSSNLQVTRVPAYLNIANEVRREFGPYAMIAWMKEVNPAPVEAVSEEYARMMSKNDNS